MDAATSNVVDSVLHLGASVALRVDSSLCIFACHNSALLAAWLVPATEAGIAPGTTLAAALSRLFASQVAATLQLQLAAVAADQSGERHDLGSLPTQARHGAAVRHLGLCVQRSTDGELLLLLRDVTAAQDLLLATTRLQATADTSMALLRAAPDAICLFLGSAMASVSALRATQRMPARTSESLRDKLARLQAGTTQLGQEAQAIGLHCVTRACGKLLETLEHLQQDAQISGNDLLPLAVLIDGIASTVGNAWRCEEQRYSAPGPVATAGSATRSPSRPRKHASWPQATERRWNDLLRRRGAETGTLAKLAVTGADLVPASLRRDIDEMLLHLLRNALEHGIETPEQRLAAEKPAAGQISISFEDKGRAGLRILVRDDGRGFDLQRIGKAAVLCGLISEESLLERDAGDLVGLIFKPAFTTEGVADCDGHGRGMTFLRNAVTRLNGQVSVATKAGRYTQFTVQLPVSVSPHEMPTPAHG
jgi:signal transduction histidine kinase